MGRKRQGAELFVRMNGENVGILARLASGQLQFSYAPEWLTSASGRPISMSMPLATQKYRGAVVENYFDNLLPDSQPTRQRIQRRFGAQSDRSFDLLWHIGRDCAGAIQLLPEEHCADVKHIAAEKLSEAEITDLLKNYRSMPLGMSTDKEFRISVAGAQEKTALLDLNGEWHRPLGTTPTSHIFKLPIGRIEHSGIDLRDSVENEWLCHLLLKAFSVEVAHTEIGVFNDTRVLIVERFDRRWAEDGSWLIRIPQEDLCQALNTPPALKYESDGGPGIRQIMDFLLGADESLRNRRAFMTRVFLFWLLGAIDGHAKNFSIFLQPGGAYQLTPAYDVISAYPLIAKKQLEPRKMNMAMAVTGKNRHYKWEDIYPRHWLMTAASCKFPEKEMAEIIDGILDNLDAAIEKVEPILPKGFPEDVAAPIFDGMRTAKDRVRK